MNPAIEPEHRPALLTSARSGALVGIDKIAEHLGVTVRHVRRLVEERRIQYARWGRLLRFDPDDVAMWLDTVQIEPRLTASIPRGQRARRPNSHRTARGARSNMAETSRRSPTRQ
jgi:excisionase family DNA binding protein